jgi:hypothetical protein
MPFSRADPRSAILARKRRLGRGRARYWRSLGFPNCALAREAKARKRAERLSAEATIAGRRGFTVRCSLEKRQVTKPALNRDSFFRGLRVGIPNSQECFARSEQGDRIFRGAAATSEWPRARRKVRAQVAPPRAHETARPGASVETKETCNYRITNRRFTEVITKRQNPRDPEARRIRSHWFLWSDPRLPAPG